MRRLVLTGATILACMSSVAMAQTTPTKEVGAPAAAASTIAASTDNVAPSPDAVATPKAADMAATNETSCEPAQNSPDATGQKAITSSDADGTFTNIPTKDDLTSQVIGLSIYNNEKNNIGTIKDIAFSRNGLKAYIVGVGGFLGMGDHYVAVRPSAVTVTYDAGTKKWHAEMDTNAAKLKAAPEYKYSS
jgi:hypothetical protein